MKKIALASVAFLMGIQSILAQGWIGNSSNNSLFPVNTSLGLTPLNIGIGTNAPSAQLHTTGSVRFGGLSRNNSLNRVLVSDSIGNLSFRDASSLNGSEDFWRLTGNTLTDNTPTNRFIGTLNDQPFNIRTNNTQRITVLGGTSGFVGLSTGAPQERLDVNGNIALRGDHIRRTNGHLTLTAEGFNQSNSFLTLRYTGLGSVLLRSMTNPEFGLGGFNIGGVGTPQGLRISYTRGDNLTGVADNTMSMEDNLTRFSDPVEITSSQIAGRNTYFRISSTTGNQATGIILNTTNGLSNIHHGVIITDNFNGNAPPPVGGPVYGNLAVTIDSSFCLNNSSAANTQHHLRIRRNGDVTLGQRLFIGNEFGQRIRLWRDATTSNVFFPNLPEAEGRVLVWNETTGQVTVAPTATANRANPNVSASDLQKKIDEQNARITQLEATLLKLQQQLNPSDNFNKKEAKLYQNVPNPANQNTVINFSVPQEAKSAKMMIYNLQGEQLKSYNLNGRGDDKVEISASELKTGMYIYTLIVDGEIVDSKKMVITN
ncbi:MAG: T9SS C-terminal target domain-containing protein [Bacteroidetes bacterium]|nr:MAG: T9SS C-terminal target domain-containing protein [Bacteroidota bacterium]